MSEEHMEEARKLAVSLGRDYPDVVERIAAALSAAEQHGRVAELERCEMLERALQEIRDNQFHHNEDPSYSDVQDFADRVLRSVGAKP